MGWGESRAGLQESTIRHFGEPWTYTPPAGAPTPVRGIFRDSAEIAITGGDVEVMSIQPRLEVKQSDLPGGAEPVPRKGSWVRDSSGEAFDVLTIEPDGDGMLVLVMEARTPK